MFEKRLAELKRRLIDAEIETALITDDDSVYYLTGYYDYLHMNFGRPTILVIQSDGDSILITPEMEIDMARSSAHVDRIFAWNDGLGNEWREALPALLSNPNKTTALEPVLMPPIVKAYVNSLVPTEKQADVTPIINKMRMIKSDDELQLARHAGLVANDMMQAARDAMGMNVQEFEVAIAASNAGTRKAAELLKRHYKDACMSPNTHFLQIMASGDEITKPHHRASTRRMQYGEPVFMCFCGMTNFHRFKLGFDRTFWIGEIQDDRQAEIYDVAIKSQAAALSVLKAGVAAEDVHAEYARVIQDAGFAYPFRCGRATGFSFLEKPELVTGDKTVLQPGMVLAVDGSVSLANTFRAQVGDSFIVTENGYEQLTSHPKAIEDMIVG